MSSDEKSHTNVLPLWLVGKRLKIWWDGNQAFLEASVDSYDAATALHTVTYLTDGDVRTEDLLGDQCSSWEWLDESQEDLTIRKRARQDTPVAASQSSDTLRSSTPTPGEALAFGSGDRYFKKPEPFANKIRSVFSLSSLDDYGQWFYRFLASQTDS